MTKPRPEAILGDSDAWQHQNSMPSVIESSANPNKKTTTALHGEGYLAETAQTIASIGAIWNSRQPKKIADRSGCELKFVITAQEIRNRSLAHQLGNALPPNRDGQRTALEHANQTKPTIWQDIAEIAHNHQELKKYCQTLAQHNPPLFSNLKHFLDQIETYSESDSMTMSLNRQKNTHRETDIGIGSIAYALSQLDEQNQQTTKRKNKKRTHGHAKEQETGSANWEQLRPKIHRLELAHKGKQRQKKIANNLGKNPSRIANYYTDPMRRVFTRKIRQKGALVIVDTSGSMNFDSDLLDDIMKASAGATVITYSDSGQNNCHLVADQGKRVKYLPDTGGNNAVDVPAILWAIKHYRKNPKQQILLISDGFATGRSQNSVKACRQELKRTIKKYDIYMEKDINASIIKLSKLGKTKLKSNPESVPNV